MTSMDAFATFIIEDGASWDTVKALHRYLGELITGQEENLFPGNEEYPEPQKVEDLRFVDAYEGIWVRIHAERPNEDGELIVGSSYSGYSSGFSEEYKLRRDEKGPYLHSSESEEW